MKARLLKVIKWVVIVVACLFVIAQFKRPAKTNPAIDPSQTLEAHVQMDPNVAAILDRSCYDCHSNKTRWPWYANVAPVSWFVIDHVNEGRDDLNFSEWGTYSRDEQQAQLGQLCDLVTEGWMPLSSYTPLHPSAKLSEEDKRLLCNWAATERARVR
jgi:hypothetical protein